MFAVFPLKQQPSNKETEALSIKYFISFLSYLDLTGKIKPLIMNIKTTFAFVSWRLSATYSIQYI